jgi:hypothetical protein
MSAGRADDAAGAAWDHDARSVLHAGQHAPDVDGHDAVEIGQVDGAQRGPRHVPAYAGVVEHHVEAAVELDGEVDGRGDLRLVGDVAAGVARGVRA